MLLEINLSLMSLNFKHNFLKQLAQENHTFQNLKIATKISKSNKINVQFSKSLNKGEMHFLFLSKSRLFQ